MEMDDAARLRKAWGNRRCSHPNLEKEYHRGLSTGDYACTTCGKSAWGSDWAEKEAEQKEKQPPERPDGLS